MTQQIPPAIAQESLVPIIVGVTGHRKVKYKTGDIILTEDKISESQKNEIKKVFEELDLKYPNTPIVLLSPLADGADRVVASLALSIQRQNRASFSLICPLPMPREEYERDFTDGSKKSFGMMLDQASTWFELPVIDGKTLADIQDWEQKPRKKQYEQVGKYIAQHSHILIALWNGEHNDGDKGLGGTSQIVKMRHEGTLATRRQLDEIDNIPIFHFLTTAIGDDKIDVQPRREIFPGMTLNPPSEAEKKDENIDKAEKERRAETAKRDRKLLEQGQENVRRVFERMEMFNRDVKRLAGKYTAKIGESKQYVIPSNERVGLPEMSYRVLHHYAIADTLAMHFQWWSDKTLQSLFVIVFLALACFELYAHLKMSHWFLLGHPLWLLVGLAIFLYATRLIKVQSKYLDYRALAEGLRVQFFWILAAQTNEVVEFYLRKQKSELDWIKYAVRSFNMPFSVEEHQEKQGLENVSPGLKRFGPLVLEHWVKDQAGYFTGKTDKEKKRLKRQHDRGKFFFILGVILAVVLFSLNLYVVQNHWEHDHLWEYVKDGFLVAIGMAIAIAAAIGGYTEKMAISAQAKRYAWMSGLFNRAETDLNKLLSDNELPKAQELISELGREALEENADWLIIRRERKIEVPTG